MTKKEEQRVRDKLHDVFKWLYTVEDIDTTEVVEYTIANASDIMDGAIEEFHDFLEWE